LSENRVATAEFFDLVPLALEVIGCCYLTTDELEAVHGATTHWVIRDGNRLPPPQN
jgi:hypothetical protein